MAKNPTLNFADQIGKWVKDVEGAFMAIARESTQEVIDKAQTTRAKGGNMPVLTGFLWNSGRTNIGSPPMGPGKGDPKGTYVFNPQTVEADIARWQRGQTMYFGWTAAYARDQEVKNGFAATAAQDWSNIVKRNEAKVKKRLGL